MNYYYTINEYQFRVCRGLSIFFYAREDKVMEQMKDLYEQGMNLKIKLKRKRTVGITKPPYEFEQEQLKILRKGLEKRYGN